MRVGTSCMCGQWHYRVWFMRCGYTTDRPREPEKTLLYICLKRCAYISLPIASAHPLVKSETASYRWYFTTHQQWFDGSENTGIGLSAVEFDTAANSPNLETELARELATHS